MEKTVELQVKASGNGQIEGYASLYGVTDSYGDSVDPGAFDMTLEQWRRKGRLPAMLWSHDQSAPIGAWTRMASDSKGLHVEGRLATKGKAAEVRELLDMQAVDGASIGYVPVVEDMIDGVNHLREIRLYEVSLCCLPALDAARVAIAKNFEFDSVRQAEQALREVARLSRKEAELFLRNVRALRESGTDLDVAAVTATLRQCELRLPTERHEVSIVWTR